MEFIDPVPTGKGPAEWFTGDVWFDVIYAGKEPSRARIVSVMCGLSSGNESGTVVRSGGCAARGTARR